MVLDPKRLSRQVRQRLEALKRAGLSHLPIEVDPAARTRRPAAPGTAGVERGPRERTGPASEPSRPGSGTAPEPSRSESRPKSGQTASPPPSKPAALGSFFDEAGFESEPLPPEARPAALRSVAEEVAACTRCPALVENRTNTVPGEGSPTARLMFIGEGPGQAEDESGRPFVGRAGQLLTDMITKGMGLKREEVFIANILKCRPPGNRDPEREEVRNCLGFLERQIEIVRPEFLCLLGRPAAQALLDTSMPMSLIRGRWRRYKGIPTIATWHPAYLLRNPASKKEAWEDLQMLMSAMGLPGPKRR